MEVRDELMAVYEHSLREVLHNLEEPYWATPAEETLPGLDFCREIIAPCEKWPEGAVGIRVDDDFWAVAALPPECEEFALEDVVRILWPGLADRATYAPDHGTPEHEAYFLRQRREEIERLEALRPPAGASTSRRRTST